MKLLSERKKLCDAGELKMCTAEYDGSWLPYEQSFKNVTDDWLLEEMTYDDCIRKEKIAEYIYNKIEMMEKQISEYKDLIEHMKCISKYIIQS